MDIMRCFALASVLSLAAAPVFAQDKSTDNMSSMDMSGANAQAKSSDNMSGMDMKKMMGMNMRNMKGMHMMGATVSAIDTFTGLTDVAAGGMKLRLQFPPASLKGVKVGDKITLHLGFTKP